jgi:hypothetical protein
MQINATSLGEAQSKLIEKILDSGPLLPSQHGDTQVIFGEQVIAVESSTELDFEYPYWDKLSDEWYRKVFVQAEANLPVEQLAKNEFVFAYRYCDRSHFYDGGLGYLLASIKILQQAHASRLDRSSKSIQAIRSAIFESTEVLHPFNFLSALAGFGLDLVNEYLEDTSRLEQLLKAQRKDAIAGLTSVLLADSTSRQAITPSFMYATTDYNGVLRAVPPYQNYQVFIVDDGESKYLLSVHQHRSLDAKGGIQLDYNHDIYWGKMVSKALGIPLRKVVIVANNCHVYLGQKNAELVNKTNIEDWLVRVTYGYKADSSKGFLAQSETALDSMLTLIAGKN